MALSEPFSLFRSTPRRQVELSGFTAKFRWRYPPSVVHSALVSTNDTNEPPRFHSLEHLTSESYEATRLGECTIPSPLAGLSCVPDDSRICPIDSAAQLEEFHFRGLPLPSFEQAGPRSNIFFEPRQTKAAIVTCGGLCPGLNNVIRSLVVSLNENYGIHNVLGVRYGYRGLAAEPVARPIRLTHDVIEDIHLFGGSLLGSSRGTPPTEEIADTLEYLGIQILFVVGGDGTLRGGRALANELRRRGRPISVIGIPKTIDNDIHWVDRSFGFSTAVAEAQRAIQAAHSEARGAWNGIGVVKVMGRHSGFLAAHAALSGPDVNFCLVPEVPIVLHGPDGFLEILRERVEQRRHAVILVAEGAGQDLLPATGLTDASGNMKLGDIGRYLVGEIERYSKEQTLGATVKYIDPSYQVRSLPAVPFDAEFCTSLAQNAVHAALAGRSDIYIGVVRGAFVHVPIGAGGERPKVLDPEGVIWRRVLEATRQPAKWGR